MWCSQTDAKSSARLSALGIIPSRAVSEAFAADYALFELNRRQLFDYVDVLDMPHPTNDVDEVWNVVVDRDRIALVCKCNKRSVLWRF